VQQRLTNVHLVTYGDNAYVASRELLRQEALRFGISNIHMYGPRRLPVTFVKKHIDFFRKNRRGGGCWLWKPLIVRDVLSHIKDGDFLLYADAGCGINPNGQKRFIEWLEICDNQNNISFQMHGLAEKHWTKLSVARLMGCEAAEIMDSGQIMAGIFGLKKNKYMVELIQEWLDICSMEWTIDDSVQSVANDPEFKEHRHDQSVFSLLRKREKFCTIPDETYAHDGNWNGQLTGSVPIWTLRRRVIWQV
jgi:hypothetical protein